MTAASVAADTHIRPSKETIYETPKHETVREYGDYEDEFLEEDAKTFVRENLGSLARPNLMPYVYKRRFLDKKFMRKDGDKLKIGDYAVLVV